MVARPRFRNAATSTRSSSLRNPLGAAQQCGAMRDVSCGAGRSVTGMSASSLSPMSSRPNTVVKVSPTMSSETQQGVKPAAQQRIIPLDRHNRYYR